jgi:hypothetical protein
MNKLPLACEYFPHFASPKNNCSVAVLEKRHELKLTKPRYKQGSIKRVERAKGYAWEVRFSERVNGKRRQRSQTFDGFEYPTEAAGRKAFELIMSQINSGTLDEKSDATFSAITAISAETIRRNQACLESS